MSIIKVENLSKKYIISHEGQERYTAMRDVVTRKVKKIFSFPKSMKTMPSRSKEAFYALKDINFEIEQGDRVGIIGRNGAGKSTLLKVLSRITEPTTGKITINGRVASLLEVGTGFHPELTGRENVYLNGAILGMSRHEIKTKFDEIVDFAEIEKFLDTPVKRYSSGMYIRLAFAVAAHLEPEILVVDEVLAVGDAQFQKKCIGKMEDVSKNEGRTILFVSHNISVIKLFCTTGILLNRGEVIKLGTIGETVVAYQNMISKAGSGKKTRYVVNKKFYFESVILENENNELVINPTLGEKITIKAKYVSLIPISQNYISFDFTIMDVYNQVVVSFISDEMACDYNNFSNQGFINCTIEKLLLRAGNYSVRVSACYNGTSHDSVLDDYEEAIVFDIGTADLNNVGRVLRNGSTALLPAHFSST